MQRLEVSGVVRLKYRSLGVKWLSHGLFACNVLCHFLLDIKLRSLKLIVLIS